MIYANDNDKSAAHWLSCLPLGLDTIDSRSIADVKGSDLDGFTQCHFFAGIGGWPYALQLAGWPADVAVWTGSCPCQPFSCAGKGKGTDDDRHLWPEFRRLIDECRPAVVFGEQVASKAGRNWLSVVRADLEALGYGVGAADLSAAGAGAFHIRQRLFWVAYRSGAGLEERIKQPARQECETTERGGDAGRMADAGCERSDTGSGFRGWLDTGKWCQSIEHHQSSGHWSDIEFIPCRDGKARPVPHIESDVCLLADGFWYRMANVLSEFHSQASKEVVNYAQATRTDPEKVLSLVQRTIGTKTFRQSEQARRQGCVCETEILLAFLRDLLSTLNRSSNGGSGAKASAEADRRMLRDLRNCVEIECASHRRESQEQQQGQSTDSLLVLSQFLARCCYSCWDYKSRTHATYFPVSGKVSGRVAQLRGLGNAIVPQVAAIFIASFIDAITHRTVEA